MKKAFSYFISICLFISVFSVNINAFSYEFLDEKHKANINYIKQQIYELTEEYKDLFKKNDNSSKFGSYSGDLCPEGITVTGSGRYSLDDYVAGVVDHEAYTGEGIEALKAQAIAARTYALNSTNFCKRPIGNSTASQTFNEHPSQAAKDAAKLTSGQILNYNGHIFSSQYDSFCFEDGDCKDSKRSGDVYTVTYTKVPSSEKHTITLKDKAQFGRIVNGAGHARGMSQLVSYQMAKEGKTYDEILTYFYATGVEIVRPTSSSSWKQYDSRWSGVKIGGATLGSVGCYVTSIAILIAKSGVSTTLGADFNPGSFAEFLNDNGSFSEGGGMLSLAAINKLVSNFGEVARDANTSPSNIQNYLNQGRYVQLWLRGPGPNDTHFVAVDYVDGDLVHISDPGSECDILNNCYPNKRRAELRVYKIG